MDRFRIAVSSLYRVLLVVVAVTLSATTANAQLSGFDGHWVNVDANTPGITTLEIEVSGTHVTVHAFGSCRPADCDWGSIEAHAYTPGGVDADLTATADTVSAAYEMGFATTILIIKLAPPSLLRVESYMRFQDGSQRSNIRTLEFMRRR